MIVDFTDASVLLAAARKGKARRVYTLNGSNFRAFQRGGDPEILSP